ncbi:chemotaxis protein [Yersinia massiliensis]|jgi:secreted effector protein SseD|uniref:Methyl-accepting chemotaxis protein n=3 Tax=Yersinia TaxID=629 RepID=A0AAI9EP53_YERFR|nr:MULTISPECIES: hypothetical protein [Yersinia]HEC1649090.1 chemotaxis protein [Yersinia enterocolitica]ATM88289.1 chemotaxis protein [Yersinia frederiksenii]MCB5317062.1 chemotaxis protein [Yersinia massiliensis]MDA5549079.1 chemotaxis protein [Yersinia massiliensis]MDN0126186.1 chemotaxis protein [Yersinia massiliensis]
MNIPVSHEVNSTQSATSVNDIKDLHESNINDVISSLSDVIFKMVELFKKMRDLLSCYNQKQEVLGWDLQVSSMIKKREAISDACSASTIGGVASICSGLGSFAGGAASISHGELAGHIGSGLGSISAGGLKIGEGSLTRDADSERLIGDMQNSSSQSYANSISDLQSKSSDSRQSIKELSKELTNLINQINMTVKL